MRKLFLVLVSATFSTFLAFPANAAVNCETNPTHPQCSSDGGGGTPTSDTYVFAGYSTDLVNGAVGLHGMNGACQDVAEFGDSARIATTKEYLESPNAAPPSSFAWIRPIPQVLGDGLSLSYIDSVMGLSLTSWPNLHCSWWTQSISSNSGYAINPAGGAVLATCNFPRPVACSAPGP